MLTSGSGSPASVVRVVLMVQEPGWGRLAVQVLAVTKGLAGSSRLPSTVSEMVPLTSCGLSAELVSVTVIRQFTGSPTLERPSQALLTSTDGWNRFTESVALSVMSL